MGREALQSFAVSGDSRRDPTSDRRASAFSPDSDSIASTRPCRWVAVTHVNWKPGRLSDRRVRSATLPSSYGGKGVLCPPLGRGQGRRRQGMTRDELVKLILAGKTGLSREEAGILGVSFPPKSGWRKKIIRSNQTKFRKELEEPKKPEPTPLRDGFVVRRTGTGKAHYWISGASLCRGVNFHLGKYTFVEDPGSIRICSLCERVKNGDPTNARDTRGDGFYSSWEWKKARYETLKRYGAKCMLCGSTWNIVVDHIKPRRFHPSLELDLDNLQVLCDECNRGKSHDDETDFRPKAGELSHAEQEELDRIHEANERLH